MMNSLLFINVDYSLSVTVNNNLSLIVNINSLLVIIRHSFLMIMINSIPLQSLKVSTKNTNILAFLVGKRTPSVINTWQQKLRGWGTDSHGQTTRTRPGPLISIHICIIRKAGGRVLPPQSACSFLNHDKADRTLLFRRGSSFDAKNRFSCGVARAFRSPCRRSGMRCGYVRHRKVARDGNTFRPCISITAFSTTITATFT